MRTDFETGTNPLSVGIGDFNRDGEPDLAVADQRLDAVSVLLGNGDGTFGTKTYFGTRYTPGVAVGDLNGDGRLDLVAPCANSAKISVLSGNGDGTFAAKTDYPTGFFPCFAAIADLNGDGRPDLAVANSGGIYYHPSGSTVSVLLGNGDGSFQEQMEYATAMAPSVAVGDVDGDGRSDLVTANTTSNTVSVLLGYGDGTFAWKVDFGAGVDPRSVVIGDLNGDGDADLAAADYGSKMVSVLLHAGSITTGVSPGPPELPRVFRLLAPKANPCRGTGEIRFQLPVACPVDLALFDLSGRKVRSLVAGTSMEPGEHAVRWDGGTARAPSCAAASTWCGARAGRDEAVRKLIVLR